MKINTKTWVTIGVVAAIAYYIYDRQKKGKGLNPFKSFASDEDAFLNSMSYVGREDDAFYNAVGSVDPVKRKIKTKSLMSVYTAGGYDSSHRNPDGSYGATWIGYNQIPSSGYWVKGYVNQGTPMYPNK